MDPFYIIYIGLYFLPMAVLFLVKMNSLRLSASVRASLYVFAISYAAIIYSSMSYELYLDYRLTQLDLNNDGFFTGSENTPEQARISERVSSDTGRTFVPFTGFVFSFLLSFLTYVGLKLYAFIRKL